ATGFLRTAVDGTSTGAANEPLAANQVIADTLKIVGSTFLGLTVGCAQCHDHRYDPIPQSDYYRLRAVFEPALDPSHWRRPGQRLAARGRRAEGAGAGANAPEARRRGQTGEPKTGSAPAEPPEPGLKKPPAAPPSPRQPGPRPPADRLTGEQKRLLAAHPSVL